MDKKSKIFFIVFFLLIAGSIGVTYYRFMVQRDYMIQAQADCDPYTEACFIYVCDPEAGEECTGDPVEDTSYYKLIDRNAKNIPLCDPADEACTALICEEGEVDCSYTVCDPATIGEGEVCSDPVVYTAENPIEEEEATDEEALAGDEETTEEEITPEENVGINTETESVGETSDATTDTEAETSSVRNSLVSLRETSCDARPSFIFVSTVRIPVDASGNYKTQFSSTKAQIVSLIDATGQVCAKSVSLPVYGGNVYVDAKSTAVASVFETTDIFTPLPEQAKLRLSMIETVPSFPALLRYVTEKLPTMNISTLATDPEFQNLVKKCSAETLSQLP